MPDHSSQAPDKAGVVEHARELLAAEYINLGGNPDFEPEDMSVVAALRAIERALSPPPVVEEAGQLIDLIRERIGQEYDGECILSEAEANRLIACLSTPTPPAGEEEVERAAVIAWLKSRTTMVAFEDAIAAIERSEHRELHNGT